MRKPNVFTTIVVSVVGLIIIPFSTFIVQPTVILILLPKILILLPLPRLSRLYSKTWRIPLYK